MNKAEINYNIPSVGVLAVVYARYSSHSQTEQSIEGQLSEAHKYAAAHGYTIVSEYVDRARSGRTDNREEFQRMLRDTAKKQFSVIIVWKVDRFGRNREEIAINKSRCHRNGVRVEYVAENIPETPEGVILESVLEGIAEYYSLQLSQNIRRGLAESAEKCQVTGGSRPLGYKTGPDKKFAIDEATAPTVQLIYKLYADGMTMADIVRELNNRGLRTLNGGKFVRNSLRTVLKNEKYRGIYIGHGKRIEGGIPRIIDDDLFFKVQEMLKINKRAPARTWARADYILSDKLFCGHCGALMYGESGTSKSGARHNYYICSAKKKAHSCDKKAVRQTDIEDLVIKSVLNLLRDDELLEQIIEQTWQYYQAQDDGQEELNALQRQLEQVETSIRNLIRAIEAGILTEDTKARMDELSAQKADLKAEIAEQKSALSLRITYAQLSYYLKKLRDGDHNGRDAQKRLIQTFVNSVFVFDDEVKITFNYSSDNSTITLKMLKDAESGEVFGRRVSCSTKVRRYELMWFATVFCLAQKLPWE